MIYKVENIFKIVTVGDKGFGRAVFLYEYSLVLNIRANGLEPYGRELTDSFNGIRKIWARFEKVYTKKGQLY